MNKLLGVITLATASAMSAVSIAGPLVTNWDFEIDSGFTSFAPGGVDGSNTNTLWNAPSTLTWGNDIGNGRSSLDVGGATNGNYTGSAVTDGAAVNTVTVTHTNNPVTGTSLLSAVLSDQIILTPTAPNPPYDGSLDISPLTIIFDIQFIETPNAGTCADASSPTPCNDIFVLDIEGAGFNPANNSLNQNFMFDDNEYNARLFIDGVGLLDDPLCAAAGASSGCFGFSTIEQQQNIFQVSLDITTETFDVPEPGSMALLGLGLAGLGFGARRKRRN